jgi:hypothetical protein
MKTDQVTGGFIPHRQLTEELSVFDAEFEACALLAWRTFAPLIRLCLDVR